MTASDDRAVTYRAASVTGEEVVMRHAFRVFSLAVEEEASDLIYAGTSQGRVLGWIRERGERFAESAVLPDLVRGLAVQPGGQLVAATCDDGKLRLLDGVTLKQVGDVIAHPDYLRDVVFSSDGSRLVTACDDGYARVWEVAAKGAHLARIANKEASDSVEYSPDGSLVALGSRNGILSLYDSETTELLGDPFSPNLDKSPSDTRLRYLTFSKKGDLLAIAQGENAGIFEFVGLTNNKVKILKLKKNLRGHEGIVRELQFSNDGNRLVTGAEDGKIILWEQNNGNWTKKKTSKEKSRIFSVELSPDEKFIVAGTLDDGVRRWTFPDLVEKEPLTHSTWVRGMTFHPDAEEHLLVTGGQLNLYFWDTETWMPKKTLSTIKQDKVIWSLDFSPTGQFLAIGSQWHSTLRSATAGFIQVGTQLVDEGENVWDVKFRADTKQVAMATNGGMALWSFPLLEGPPSDEAHDFFEALVGVEVENNGTTRVIEDNVRLKRLQVAETETLEPAAVDRWAKWILSDESPRMLSPGLKYELAKYCRLDLLRVVSGYLNMLESYHKALGENQEEKVGKFDSVELEVFLGYRRDSLERVRFRVLEVYPDLPALSLVNLVHEVQEQSADRRQERLRRELGALSAEAISQNLSLALQVARVMQLQGRGPESRQLRDAVVESQNQSLDVLLEGLDLDDEEYQNLKKLRELDVIAE